MVDIKKHRELEAKATPGPWTHDNDMGQIIYYPEDKGPSGINHSHVADMAFGVTGELIVAMRNDHRAMLDELEAARAVIAAAKDVLDEHHNCTALFETLEYCIRDYDVAATKGER